MTEVNPAGFAFMQLRRSISLTSSGLGLHDEAYQLGRLYEARILAAQGVALRVFDADEALRFLIRTDDSLVNRRLAAEHYNRLPDHPRAEQLLKIWEGQAYEKEVYRQFSRTLALRNYIDNLPTFASFYSSILFDTDSEWQSAKEGRRSSGQRDSTLLDGAHRASCTCADALGILTGSPGQLTAPWPGLVGDQIPVTFSGFGSWLAKFDRSYVETIEGTFSLARYKRPDNDPPSDFVLSRLFYDMLELWASTPERHLRSSEAQWFEQELDVRAALATPTTGTLAYSLDFGMPWASLLWRLSPMDERTLTRYDEAVDLTLEYLASVRGELWP
jgi:hypothetical protein